MRTQQQNSRVSSRVAAAFSILLLSAASAAADVGCPASHDGSPLTKIDGAAVYLGDPAKQFIQVPDEQNQSPDGRWWNLFKFRDSSAFSVVCQYDGGYRTAFILPSGLSQCRQDESSFVCR